MGAVDETLLDSGRATGDVGRAMPVVECPTRVVDSATGAVD